MTAASTGRSDCNATALEGQGLTGSRHARRFGCLARVGQNDRSSFDTNSICLDYEASCVMILGRSVITESVRHAPRDVSRMQGSQPSVRGVVRALRPSSRAVQRLSWNRRMLVVRGRRRAWFRTMQRLQRYAQMRQLSGKQGPLAQFDVSNRHARTDTVSFAARGAWRHERVNARCAGSRARVAKLPSRRNYEIVLKTISNCFREYLDGLSCHDFGAKFLAHGSFAFRAEFASESVIFQQLAKRRRQVNWVFRREQHSAAGSVDQF